MTVAVGANRDTAEQAITRPTVFTVERAIYVAITAAALAVRLVQLGRWPMLSGEASTALAAWRTAQGHAWHAETYVPLLLDAQALLFWLGQASDTAARLLPASAGAALVWLPWALRDRLGRVGAIAAALLLALAPVWVFASRTAEWPVLSAAVSALLLAGLSRDRGVGTARGGLLAAVAVGIGLTAGPGILSTALGLAIVALVTRAMEGHGVARESVMGGLRGPATARNIAVAAGTFLAVGSALLANVDGVAQSVEWAGRWVTDLRPGASGLGPFYFPATVALYEPLTLALALTGAVWGVVRRNALDCGLAAWALAVFFLGTALGHRDPLWLTDALLPLVLLAARGAQRAWDALRPGARAQDGVAIYGALIVTTFGLLALARYVYVADDTWRGYALLTAGALLIAWVAYWLWSAEQGIRVGAVVVLTVLAIYTIRSSTALAFQTGRDPREPIVRSPTSVSVRDVEQLLASTTAHFALDPAALTIEYSPGLQDVIAWMVRAYPLATPEPTARAGGPEAQVLIRPSTDEEGWPSGYVGQTFRLSETWDWQASGLAWHELLRWLLYRAPVGIEGAETVQFWVRMSDG